MSKLEAIKYERGSLQLLDQRLLPNQSIYLEVAGCEDAHRMIKDMAVRGAPAIAVAGILALAVELHNSGSSQFASAEEACSAIKTKLCYLVTRCGPRSAVCQSIHRRSNRSSCQCPQSHMRAGECVRSQVAWQRVACQNE